MTFSESYLEGCGCANCEAERERNEDRLKPWEHELLTGYREGYGKVTFTRSDGRSVVLDNVRIDSVGPDTGPDAHILRNVVAEQEDGTMVHLPFIESWTVSYG